MNKVYFVPCPYNKSHLVQPLRLQAHLVKCEKKYPPLAICGYNATHRVPQSQLASHIADCPSKIVVYDKRFTEYEKRVVNPEPFPKPGDPDYECWDD